jgi:hypothetical protein
MKRLWGSLGRAHAVAPVVILLLSVVVLVAAAIRFWGFNTSTGCPSFNADFWPTGAFTAVVGAFFLGGLLGKLPHRHPGPNQVAGPWTQLGLTVFTLAITGAWFYETKAVADPSLHPITFFIMCTKANENDWTLLVFIAAALIAGRWLWHQPSDVYLK